MRSLYSDTYTCLACHRGAFAVDFEDGERSRHFPRRSERNIYKQASLDFVCTWLDDGAKNVNIVGTSRASRKRTVIPLFRLWIVIISSIPARNVKYDIL